MSRKPSLADIQKAYSDQYDNSQSISPTINDIQQAYRQQYGNQQSQTSPITNLLENLGHGAMRGGQVLGAGALQLGRGIGDVEWKALHGLGNLLGISNGPAQTYEQQEGSAEKALGLPETTGYKHAVDITSALLGAMSPETLTESLLGKSVLGGAKKLLPAMAKSTLGPTSLGQMTLMGAAQDPDHPLQGAALGAGGHYAGEALNSIGGQFLRPFRSVSEKISPTEKLLKSNVADSMDDLSNQRSALEKSINSKYNKVKNIAGNELTHEEIFGYHYPEKMEGLPEDIKKATLRGAFPENWEDNLNKVFGRNTDIQNSYKEFEENPTVKNTLKFKEILNKYWPKEGAADEDVKKDVIQHGVSTLKNEFLFPTLDRLDAEHGTNLFDDFKNAENLNRYKMENFGKGKYDKLNVATKGGAYSPNKYEQYLKVLENAVETGKAPIGGPVQNTAAAIRQEMLNHSVRLAKARERGFVKKGALRLGQGLAGVPGIPGFAMQSISPLASPLSQLLAQKNRNY